MKIIFAYIDKLTSMWPAASFREVFRKLPDCEVVECHDFESIKSHAQDADVFIAAGTAMVPLSSEQQRELMGLFGDRVLKGHTSLDPWESKQPIYRDMPWGFTTSFSKEKWDELRRYDVYWLPNACDVRDYGYERDIDILVWGKVMFKYPFRMHIAHTLNPLVSGTAERIDECLKISSITIGGKQYRYAVCARGAKYYSEEIYKLISRSRICATGPTGYFIPLAKYVENAACGCITMTKDFTDREELGFRDKENIWLTDEKAFLTDLQYLLEHDDVVDSISAAGKQLISDRHTTPIRAREFHKFLCQKKGIIVEKEQPLDNRILVLSGYMQPQELGWLLQASRSVPDGGVIVEVGSFCGRSTAALCQGADHRKMVVAIDPFDDEAMAQRPDWHVDVSDMFMEFNRTMSMLRYFPAVLRMKSVDAAAFFPDGSVDMVFIDGDNSLIAADLDAWGTKVKPGGILSGHDWGLARYPVKQEVSSRYPQVENVVKSIWKVQL